MLHAMILGAIGMILSSAGAIGTWNAGPEYGAKWYPLALIAIAIPCAWIGGKITKPAFPNRSITSQPPAHQAERHALN